MTADFFKQTYYAFHPKLYRVAFAILQNTDDAQDIVQDTYLKLWNERKKLVDVEKPEAYCVIMVKNLCMDFIRLHRTASYNENIDDVDCPDQAPNPATQFELDERMKRTIDAIRRLPEKQQKVLDLRAFADCSQEEIEQITGESAENVRVLLSRARKTLKLLLKQYDNGR